MRNKLFIIATLVLGMFALVSVFPQFEGQRALASCPAGRCEAAGACWTQATGADGCVYSCVNGGWANPNCGSSDEQARRQQEHDSNKAEYDRRVAEQQAAEAQRRAQEAANAAARARAQAEAEAAARRAAEEAAKRDAANQNLRDMGADLPTYSGGDAVSQTNTGSATTGTSGVANQSIPAASTTCSGSYPTARLCQGKSVGYSPPDYSSHVCVRTSLTYCALMPKSEVGGNDSDGDGIVGTITTANADQQASGACPFVISCQCGTSVKQHCTTHNIYGSSNVEAHCANEVCPDVGTGNKKCEPGAVRCLNDGTSQGYVCKNDGSDYNAQPVHAHACGATHTIVNSYCLIGNSGTKGGCFTDLSSCNQARSYLTNGQCQTVSDVTQWKPGEYTSVSDINGEIVAEVKDGELVVHDSNFKNGVVSEISCEGNTTGRIFVGCGNLYGDSPAKNCYKSCATNNITCEASQMSCGANEAYHQASASDQTTTTTTTTTETTPTPTATPTTPTGPQCTNIAPSNGAPKIGDQVAFTCTGTPSDLIVRYEFRYGVTTGEDISVASLQSLAPAQGTPNISVPITVDRVGTYFAQCRPCTANACLDWESAQLK